MVTYRQFVIKTLKLTFYLIIALAVLSFLNVFRPFLFASWASLFFFMGLTLFSGYYNSRSIKKTFFFNIYIMTLTAKFLATLFFVGIYFYEVHPTHWVAIPIMFFFTIYKVFETILLLQFSKDMEGLV